MTITIYAEFAAEVTKRLERMARKASRYGVPMTYKVGAEYPKTIHVLDDSIFRSHDYKVAAVDVEIECDGLIKADGWTVRAKIEHGSYGNIVTGYGDCNVPPEWYKVPPKCDHCHTHRSRFVTYMCEHTDGSIRQIGAQCLRAYTGIFPETAALWAEISDIDAKVGDCARDEWESGCHIQMYAVSDILAYAYDAIKEYGYRKSSEAESTRDEVMRRLLGDRWPSADGMKKAAVVRDWLVSLEQVAHDQDAAISAAWKKASETGDDNDVRAAWAAEKKDISNIERNCISLALSGWARDRHVGVLAYMPLAYDRYMERKAHEEQRREAGARSQHIGNVKQRITIEADTVTLLSSWVGDYGTTWLYKFVDSSGNVYIWYASHKCDIAGSAKIKATVKDHNERDGVKQTVVTRCKVLA